MVANKQKAAKRKVSNTDELKKADKSSGKLQLKVEDESASDYYESDEVGFACNFTRYIC